MQIDFVEREYGEEDGKLSERYYDMLDDAAGTKEVEAISGKLTEDFVAAVTPANLKGVDYPKLPDGIHEAVSKFENATSDLELLAKKVGFNAGYAAGLAEGVLLGKYGHKAR